MIGVPDNQNAFALGETRCKRALLLVKPVGKSDPFTVSESEASLMDIAPTILEALAVDNDLEFDGKVLTEVVKGPTKGN